MSSELDLHHFERAAAADPVSNIIGEMHDNLAIFLQIPEHDPSTVHYFLSVPKGDVGKSTGWNESDQGNNRLHLTSVGQLLAFTLQALRTRPRDNAWRLRALEQLDMCTRVRE